MTCRIKPDPNVIHPVGGYEKEIYVKPTIKNPAIIVGDFTYIADSDFESHVTHLYEWNGDRLIIGKFCQIAAGVEFVMNGANHQMNAVTTFPFYTLSGWDMKPPALSDLPLKGDTVIGNDVWIGQNATIMPGVHIGDGAIIGANSTVASDVPPYTIVAGNPARPIRRRFDDEMIELLERFAWWDKPIDEINALIPLLTSGELEKVRKEIKMKLKRRDRMSIQERAEKGAAYKAEGRYNCTRSVLAAFSDIVKIDEKELAALTSGFAAGMGNMEGTCGALVGAVMVAGIISEGNGTFRYSRIIADKFKELCGATICRDLKGIDGTHPLCSCHDCVKNAVLALGCAFDIDSDKSVQN